MWLRASLRLCPPTLAVSEENCSQCLDTTSSAKQIPSTSMDRPSAASTSFSSSIAAILLGQHGEWLAQSSLGAQLDLGCIILRLQA
jgi:hypothetical protein